MSATWNAKGKDATRRNVPRLIDRVADRLGQTRESDRFLACWVGVKVPLPFTVVIGYRIGRGKDMKCAGCGRGVGNDTIEAKFLFMRHELECLEAIHVEELASL